MWLTLQSKARLTIELLSMLDSLCLLWLTVFNNVLHGFIMEVIIKTLDAIALYGDAANLARSLGVSRAAISQWGEHVPEVSARGLLILSPSILHEIKKPTVRMDS